MDPLEGTFYGRLSTDLTSELTHFNPGIRVRNLEQLAFFSASHNVEVAFFEQLAAGWGYHHDCRGNGIVCSCVNHLFSNFARETDRSHSNMTGNRHVLFLQVWSFCFFGEVNQLCTQFVKT